MDTATTLRVFSHELRLPASVIQGYARLLRDGALSDADRDRALAQIQQATGRLADLARDASAIAQWLTAPPQGNGGDNRMSSIIERATTAAALDQKPVVEVSAETATLQVPTDNVQALTTAFSRVLEATAREAPHEPLAVNTRFAHPGMCDVLVAPRASATALQALEPGGPGTEPVMLIRGGLGLSLVLATAIFEAHHGVVWTQSGSHGMIVRLPTQGAHSS